MFVIKRLFLVFFIFFLAVTKTIAADKINAFVSILPQQYFVQQVGGDLVDVQVMVGPGQNPSTYEPTPQKIAALSHADVYFSIGVPFESAWINKIKQTNRQLVIVECCQSLASLDGHIHDNDDNHADPHVWTSPKKVIQLVHLIEQSLIQLNAEYRQNFENSASTFINALTELDISIDSRLSELNKREFIVSHPSWAYFADEYNLSQISIEQNGKEIQARSMVKLIKAAKEKNIKAVFVQRQFNDKAAKIIANEIGANIYDLDPLAFNYIENMNDVTNKIVQGLSHE
jgi:zinc transport system substrate-binding protein